MYTQTKAKFQSEHFGNGNMMLAKNFRLPHRFPSERMRNKEEKVMMHRLFRTTLVEQIKKVGNLWSMLAFTSANYSTISAERNAMELLFKGTQLLGMNVKKRFREAL